MRTIIEDTRNKPEKNFGIRCQLEELGYKVVRSKVYCGDYVFADNGQIAVDTKQNLQEVVGNVTSQHKRFQDECVRAKEAGIQLVILITEPNIRSIDDVFGWFNPRRIYSKKATTGRQLAKIMLSMEAKYSVKFEFCTKDNVGERIVDLLGGGV